MTNRLPLGTLTGASLIIVAVAVAAIVLGRPGPGLTVGASAAPSDVAVASVQPSQPAGPARTATPRPTATTAPTITPAPTIAPCNHTALAARITLWEGAAGNRIATVELKNTGTSDCILGDRTRPSLIGGDGTVLIAGKDTTTSHDLVMVPGVIHSTAVDVANYCGPAPHAPVTVAFQFADGKVQAAPLGPTDATVPPCNGPSQAAMIDMHPWSS